MQRKQIKLSLWRLLLTVLIGTQMLYAQLAEKLFVSDYHIDSLRNGQLSVELDNLSFFKNNEFNSTMQKGYTLPGFWLQLKACYYPLSGIKLEAGAHSIWFWGSTLYPAFAYKGISTWNGRDYAHHVHVLPYFRAQVALSKQLTIILGDIYGGSNHGLIKPLYNPELNMTSDPEAGVQLLYDIRWLHLDTWVDWMTYIYNLDTHQEAFAAGGAAQFNINAPESQLHFYARIQGLAHHKGGEIDATDTNIQTVMNGALGAGLKWNKNGRVVQFIQAEFDKVGSVFPKGRTYQPETGHGYYAKSAIQLKNFNINASYWACKDFITIYGSPFYGAISAKHSGALYENPTMINLGADYAQPLGEGFTLGIKAEAYRFLSGKMISTVTGLYQPSAFGNNENFSIGIFLRINPSFPVKKF